MTAIVKNFYIPAVLVISIAGIFILKVRCDTDARTDWLRSLPKVHISINIEKFKKYFKLGIDKIKVV